ncbi:hypothetical protein HMPREF0742_02308 [Rothia aeria F0184]|uniref:Uncharacterized protein n=1 Tax=Rothia aeria F0184 TaxID=888019 RepID=U7UY54_9MICC|nr:MULTISPECIES: hypothetical protein [Rothia]ERT64372.1 hypothetical protein HMPREF0742_02308 [Rothia aeria F0184]QXW92193.1 hypothetical protein LPB401_09135 [Rothia aeria]
MSVCRRYDNTGYTYDDALGTTPIYSHPSPTDESQYFQDGTELFRTETQKLTALPKPGYLQPVQI